MHGFALAPCPQCGGTEILAQVKLGREQHVHWLRVVGYALLAGGCDGVYWLARGVLPVRYHYTTVPIEQLRCIHCGAIHRVHSLFVSDAGTIT